MDNTNETIADIIREMRNSPFSWSIPSEIPGVEKCNCEAEKLADRIEAAAKREREEVESDALSVGGIVEATRNKIAKDTAKIEQCAPPIAKNPPNFYQPGNAAALREALLSVRKPINYRGGDLARYTLPVIDAALKTPPEPAGNAAMMRMALEVLWDVIGQFSDNILDGQMQLVLSDRLIPAINAYHHALAAPARNCDILSEEAANEAWDEYRHSHVLPRGGWDFRHVIALLYAPAEGGEHA